MDLSSKIDNFSKKRQYIAIDLKSFYASVECVERGLDPLDVCLVVADSSRTDKTICLAVTPALKSFGIGGRPRLFEVVRKVKSINRTRGRQGKSTSGTVLAAHPEVSVDYFVVPPRMSLYVKYSTRIYSIYMKFVAPEDIHVYSIDEVFIDATPYMETYGVSAHQFAMIMIREVLKETGITATAGIGTNLYLSKVAMDITAKKMKPDADGVRIAELDEISYRRTLWDHKPLTDFWRVGRGTVSRLAPYGIDTMGKIARFSLTHEDLFYRLFGVNAELLIDHAWGWEPVTMDKIKTYSPDTKSISSGQVLTCPYSVDKARIVVMEMVDSLALDLFDKGYVTNQIVLDIGYDVESLTNLDIGNLYDGPVTTDRYGRRVPRHAHGSANLGVHTYSSEILLSRVGELFDRIVNPILLVRRLTLYANNLLKKDKVANVSASRQLDLFTDYEAVKLEEEKSREALNKERRRQQAVLGIKKRFGKNAILRGLNFAEGATQKERNRYIGGHHE